MLRTDGAAGGATPRPPPDRGRGHSARPHHMKEVRGSNNAIIYFSLVTISPKAASKKRLCSSSFSSCSSSSSSSSSSSFSSVSSLLRIPHLHASALRATSAPASVAPVLSSSSRECLVISRLPTVDTLHSPSNTHPYLSPFTPTHTSPPFTQTTGASLAEVLGGKDDLRDIFRVALDRPITPSSTFGMGGTSSSRRAVSARAGVSTRMLSTGAGFSSTAAAGSIYGGAVQAESS
jgi:hypothetical protein